MARLICSLTGMPSRSLIARSAAFWSGGRQPTVPPPCQASARGGRVAVYARKYAYDAGVLTGRARIMEPGFGSRSRYGAFADSPTAARAKAPVPFTHRQILIISGGLCTGLFLAALDQTIVATALPTIVGELGGLDYYSWVVTAYLPWGRSCARPSLRGSPPGIWHSRWPDTPSMHGCDGGGGPQPGFASRRGTRAVTRASACAGVRPAAAAATRGVARPARTPAAAPRDSRSWAVPDVCARRS